MKKPRSLTNCLCTICGTDKALVYDDRNEEYLCPQCLFNENEEKEASRGRESRARDFIPEYDRKGRRIQ